MVYLGLCDPCKRGNHEAHEESHHTPPPELFVCGGGSCICDVCYPEQDFVLSQDNKAYRRSRSSNV